MVDKIEKYINCRFLYLYAKVKALDETGFSIPSNTYKCPSLQEMVNVHMQVDSESDMQSEKLFLLFNPRTSINSLSIWKLRTKFRS